MCEKHSHTSHTERKKISFTYCNEWAQQRCSVNCKAHEVYSEQPHRGTAMATCGYVTDKMIRIAHRNFTFEGTRGQCRHNGTESADETNRMPRAGSGSKELPLRTLLFAAHQ